MQFATEEEGLDRFGESIRYEPTFSLNYRHLPRQSFPFDMNIQARYVKLQTLSNFYNQYSLSDGNQVGLGEIAFQSNFNYLRCAKSSGGQISGTGLPKLGGKTRWVLGDGGDTCNEACNHVGGTCNSGQQTKLDTCDKMKMALKNMPQTYKLTI